MLRVAVLAAVLLVAAVSAEHVAVLTAANFDEKIAQYPIALVEFYAPWCGHCKRLEPEYEKAAEDLASFSDILVAKVDATIEESLGTKFKIQGFPTIKLFRGAGSEPTDYEGGRTARDIVSYLKKQQGPAVKDLKDAAELSSIKPTDESADPILVAFAKAGSETAEFFSKFASKFRDDFNLYLIESDVEGEKDNTIVLYKPFDELRAVYDGALEDTALRAWGKGQSLRLVDQIGPENYRSYVERKLPILWLFLDPSKEDVKNQQLEQYKQVAPEFRELSFVWLNGVQYGQMLTKLGVSGMPSLAIETPEGEKFPFDASKEITADAVRDWLGQWKSGSLPAHVRSEAVPETPTDEDNVHILVGNNFKEVALDANTDVLVEFYAPWCGHCKSLTPIYASLATNLKNVEGIKIAKIDATANDVPKEFAVQGFPTLKLIKAGNNEIVDYNGARTEEAFIEFLKTNAANGSKIGSAGASGEKKDKGHDEL